MVARPHNSDEANFANERHRYIAAGEYIGFEYDGAQQRVRKTTLAEETVYVGGLYERVTDFGTGGVQHRYHVHAGGRAVATMLRAAGEPSRTRYLHVDPLGSLDAVRAARRRPRRPRAGHHGCGSLHAMDFEEPA